MRAKRAHWFTRERIRCQAYLLSPFQMTRRVSGEKRERKKSGMRGEEARRVRLDSPSSSPAEDIMASGQRLSPVWARWACARIHFSIPSDPQ